MITYMFWKMHRKIRNVQTVDKLVNYTFGFSMDFLFSVWLIVLLVLIVKGVR
jgi:hypothetical protein